MKKISFIILLVLSTFSLYSQQTDSIYKPVKLPKDFTAKLNTIYTKVDGWEGRMDIYLPPKGDKPTAVVINIHGGAWVKGVKESQSGFSSFFKMGFAVANMEYRLAATAKAPAAVEDARCAFIYLIQNAKELNIDPSKIVIMGGSAGGHLALMAGLLGNNHIFDKNCPGVENIKAAAIIDKYGISEVEDFAYGTSRSKSGVLWLGDKAKDDAFIKSLSPINYVNKNNPPVFIVHGDADPTVSYQQSVRLQKKLAEAGVFNEFITVKGGVHGKFSKEDNDNISLAILNFFKKIKLIN